MKFHGNFFNNAAEEFGLLVEMFWLINDYAIDEPFLFLCISNFFIDTDIRNMEVSYDVFTSQYVCKIFKYIHIFKEKPQICS